MLESSSVIFCSKDNSFIQRSLGSTVTISVKFPSAPGSGERPGKCR